MFFRNSFLRTPTISKALVLLAMTATFEMLNAQVSEEGTPPSFANKTRTKSALATTSITAPDLSLLQQEDELNDGQGKPYRIAKMLETQICMASAGTWDTLVSQQTIWQLNLTSSGALGLQLFFDNFFLPEGSKLFIYDEDKQFVIGAFTSKNNQSSGVFATEVIPGESCTLEYVAGTSPDTPSFCINKVGYVYRGMNKILATKLKSASSDCEVNVRCSPEGDNWNQISRSTAMILIDGYQCTGNLLNNTAQDYKNYFSTAYHCIAGHETALSSAMFYFNRVMSGCSTSSTLNSGNTVTGAELRAEIPLQKGADGALLEISGEIPSRYNVYWAGWDLNDTLIGGGSCIHHPEGDPQKISTIKSVWKPTTWHSSDTIAGAMNAHWDISFEKTENGHGITESGSSGAGLFGPNELYMGTLSGGVSTCNDPYLSNLFGKFSYNWDQHDTLPEGQFKYWLDPLKTGQKKLNGLDKNTSNGVNWSSSLTVISEQGWVTFKDESEFQPIKWKWKFPGGTPSYSDSSTAKIQYKTPGLYEVSLEVTNNKGKFTKLRTDFIFVTSPSYWVEQNSGFKTKYRGISGFSVVDSSVAWAWAFDGANSNNFILEYTTTSNGGDLWTPDSIAVDSLKGFGFSNMAALGPDTAYACIFNSNGGGMLLMTPDTGKTWKNVLPKAFQAPKGFPDFVHFFNKKNGVVVGDPNHNPFEIYTTADSGRTWIAVADTCLPDTLKNETLGAIGAYAAIGDSLLWFGTSKGRVYYTRNCGLKWDVSITGLSFIADIKFSDAKNGLAINTFTPYTIKKTTDGGLTWMDFAIPTNCLRGKWAFLPGDSAYWVTVGSATPYGSCFSTDSAKTFASIDNNVQYSSLGFYNHDIGWAGGFNTDSAKGGIYKWNRLNRVVEPIIVGLLPAEKEPFEGKLMIFPNPATSELTISKGNLKPGMVKVKLISIQGKVVTEYSFKNTSSDFSQQINISHLPTGIFIVNIQSQGYSGTSKLIHTAY